MANTHWEDKTSVEILSTHISGLQDGVKNIEQALNMDTEVVTNYPLTLLDDADGVWRIAEARGKRNWLNNPAPVIQQNINTVWTTIDQGFTIDYAGGAIIFTEGKAGEEYRASFTRVTASQNLSTDGIAVGRGTKTGNIGTGSGDNHIAIGNGANTQESYSWDRHDSIAIGTNARSSQGAVSIGKDCVALRESVCIGSNTESRDYSLSIGPWAETHVNYGCAVGPSAQQSSYEGSAFGYAATAGDLYWGQSGCNALGTFATAHGRRSLAIGYNGVARGESDIAVGHNARTGNNAHGWKTMAAQCSVSELDLFTVYTTTGTGNTFLTTLAAGNRIRIDSYVRIVATVIDDNTFTVTVAFDIALTNRWVSKYNNFYATAPEHIAIGNAARTSYDNAALTYAGTIAIGGGSVGLGNYALALGYAANSSGENTVAIGYQATATAANDFILGNSNNNVKVPGTLEVLPSGGGIVVKTPDGTNRYRIGVDNSGVITATLL